MTPIEIVVFLSIAVNKLVEAFVTPLFDKFKWDKFPIMYIAWAFTTALVLLANVNIFVDYFPSVLLGKILTGIVAGGGANFIHDIFDKKS